MTSACGLLWNSLTKLKLELLMSRQSQDSRPKLLIPIILFMCVLFHYRSMKCHFLCYLLPLWVMPPLHVGCSENTACYTTVPYLKQLYIKTLIIYKCSALDMRHYPILGVCRDPQKASVCFFSVSYSFVRWCSLSCGM